ncbi:MAG TPA: GreA/GreB family elongation factor [Flavobacteriales bacterium]|nr:GreA/GreB family elongation factor [Flavobacteriales bacterium]
MSFTAPIARALIGKRVGEEATYPLGSGEQRLEVLAIANG